MTGKILTKDEVVEIIHSCNQEQIGKLYEIYSNGKLCVESCGNFTLDTLMKDLFDFDRYIFILIDRGVN